MNIESDLLRYVQTPVLRVEKVEAILKNEPFNNKDFVNEINPDNGFSALQYSVANVYWNYYVTELLLKHGANVLAKNEKDANCTPLLYAVRNRNVRFELIELLLKYLKETDDNYTEESFFTVLFDAIKNPKLDPTGIEKLYKYLSDVCTRNGTKVEASTILDILKRIVLDRANEEPRCINDFYTCTSVLKKRYFDLFSRLLPKDTVVSFVNNCILEITRMKIDGISSLLIDTLTTLGTNCYSEENPDPVCPLYRMCSYGLSEFGLLPKFMHLFHCRRMVPMATRIVNMWSDNSYPIYMNVLESKLTGETILRVLWQFRLYAREHFDSRYVIALRREDTQIIMQHLSQKDLVNLVEAFYGPFEYSPSIESKEGSLCKKQRLN